MTPSQATSFEAVFSEEAEKRRSRAPSLATSMPEMAESTARHDTITCNPAPSSCEKDGEWRLALGLWAESEEDGSAARRHHLPPTISAGEKAGEGQSALGLFGQDGGANRAAGRHHPQRCDQRLRQACEWECAFALLPRRVAIRSIGDWTILLSNVAVPSPESLGKF